VTGRRLLGRLLLALAVLPLPAQLGYRGFNPAFMDLKTPPGQDFYQYAVGAWLAATPVPADYGRFGVDEEVDQRRLELLHSILETAATTPGTEAERKLGDFYAAGMDLAAIGRAGLEPLAGALAGIRAVRSRAGLARELAALHRSGFAPGFQFSVEQDDRDSSRWLATLAQGGLGLPERDYYLRPDPRSRALRAAYAGHAARLFRLLGEPPAAARRQAATVLAIETRLARAAMDRVARRDPLAVYHLMDRRDLARGAGGLDWAAFFGALGGPAGPVPAPGDPLLVRQPAFFRELGRLAGSLPLGAWRTYLRWNLVRDSAPHLGPAFEAASFDFYGRVLSGVRTPLPRWQRLVLLTDAALPDLLGRPYVERAFPEATRARARELVERLRAALAGRIRQLAWLEPATRVRALAKLDALAVKLGHPDVWRDYAALPVDRRSHLGNLLAAWTFEFDHDLARLGRPVDRSEWDLSAATNNATYNPSLNEICLPAGILVPPYFDPEADDAVNYGSLGATIGHELTHAFDDEGRHYDARGNLADWWTRADVQAFRARTGLLVRQFDRFEPLPGLTLNGKATLGENLADLGGLRIAFDAFRASREGRPDPPRIDGFTADQRFFLAYAESWRAVIREEALREQVLTDPHAPARYRVNGPLANLPEFHRAFGVRDGEPMCRPEAERPTLW